MFFWVFWVFGFENLATHYFGECMNSDFKSRAWPIWLQWDLWNQPIVDFWYNVNNINITLRKENICKLFIIRTQRRWLFFEFSPIDIAQMLIGNHIWPNGGWFYWLNPMKMFSSRSVNKFYTRPCFKCIYIWPRPALGFMRLWAKIAFIVEKNKKVILPFLYIFLKIMQNLSLENFAKPYRTRGPGLKSRLTVFHEY